MHGDRIHKETAELCVSNLRTRKKQQPSSRYSVVADVGHYLFTSKTDSYHVFPLYKLHNLIELMAKIPLGSI